MRAARAQAEADRAAEAARAATPPPTSGHPTGTPETEAPIENTAIEGLVLLVDVVPLRGMTTKPLSDYYLPILRELERQYEVKDLRCGENSSPLAYGKWEGLLAAIIRDMPPSPGVYAVIGGDAISRVVVAALTPIATMVLRGVR
jgi:hypothetical protein